MVFEPWLLPRLFLSFHSLHNFIYIILLHKIYFLENSDRSLDISKEISYIMFVSTGKLQILHNYFFAAFKSDLCGPVHIKIHALASNVGN